VNSKAVPALADQANRDSVPLQALAVRVPMDPAPESSQAEGSTTVYEVCVPAAGCQRYAAALQTVCRTLQEQHNGE
jgi:hypothetical protein